MRKNPRRPNLVGLTHEQEALAETNFNKEFAKFEQELKQKRASNTNLQAKKQMTHEQRVRKSINALARKIHLWRIKNGVSVPSFQESMDEARRIARNVEEQRHKSYVNHLGGSQHGESTT